MEEEVFYVQGSEQEPYRVTFQLRGEHLSALCNCKAGQNGQVCKHRLGILCGDDSNVVGNARMVETVAGWLGGSDLGIAFAEWRSATVIAEKAAKAVKAAEKKVAKVMRT